MHDASGGGRRFAAVEYIWDEVLIKDGAVEGRGFDAGEAFAETRWTQSCGWCRGGVAEALERTVVL